jgi:hypothetical protein
MGRLGYTDVATEYNGALSQFLIKLLVLKFVYYVCIYLIITLGTLFVNIGSVIFSFAHSLIQTHHSQHIIFNVLKPETLSERLCPYSAIF